ncbi:hypothetical protein V6N13_036227 [Hibiscus sabdariffa]|uniref:Uncharacterized protein n=1 Tax=Hibiscus sabdariffa TaxID=183260 RepID=A0ABR2S7J2_9ROSI
MGSKTHTDPEKLNEAKTTENEDRSPMEEVALVVPETDDPSFPVMTFRAWFLDLTSCVVLIFLNTFFTYRTQPLTPTTGFKGRRLEMKRINGEGKNNLNRPTV